LVLKKNEKKGFFFALLCPSNYAIDCYLCGMSKPITITAALPYANGPLHIGHLAGAYLPADIFARYQRLHNQDVAFICGSDEHGAAITLRARKEGISPKEIIDTYHDLNRKAFEDFGISFDIYHRTSDSLHKETAQAFFLNLLEKEALELRESEQFYDEQFQQFLADRYITGACPKCKMAGAYGDQCEKCGSSLNPDDLIDPKSTLSGSTPVKRKTSHWYLPMQNHQEWLQQWLSTGRFDDMAFPITEHQPSAWKANVMGQCTSWLQDGLKPRAMTRDLDWGVPVPLPNSEGKVLYVWLDAPIGYISATKAWAEQTGKSWQRYWAEPDARLIHFIGKDNIVFHCLIFPILLKSHGGFVLPENVPANEFLNLEGQKIPTSRNHAVWLHEYLQDFPGKRDELRYVLCSIAPETGDSEFTWKDFQTRVNSELVAVLGNLVNRVMVLHHTYFQGKCTRASGCLSAELQASVERMYGELQNHVEAYRFRSGLQSVMELAREGNRHLTQCEPWKTIKTNPEQAQADLEDMLWMLAHLACGLQPFLPDTAQKILHMLNLPAQLAWQDEIQWNAGHALNPTQMLFEKIEDTDMEKQREKLNPPAAEQTAGPSLEAALAPISFQDFSRCDIRVATVLSAEPVEGANRLLKLTVDTGIDTRTVVSGIAEHYSPESVVGRKVCLLVNLEPRKLRGVESQGMVLMAQDLEGRLHFVAPPEGVNNGAQVK